MKVFEFILAASFGAWLVEGSRRSRYFPELPRFSLTPTERKVAEAVRTLAATPAPERLVVEDKLPEPRPYNELQREHFEELVGIERRIQDFGAAGATFMESEPGYTGEPLAEELE